MAVHIGDKALFDSRGPSSRCARRITTTTPTSTPSSGTTRFAGGGSARVDATPEAIEKAIAWTADRLATWAADAWNRDTDWEPETRVVSITEKGRDALDFYQDTLQPS